MKISFMKNIITFVFIVITITTNAQDSAALKKLETKTIYFLNNSTMLNGVKLNNTALKTEMQKFPETAAAYKLYTKNYCTAKISLALSIASIVAGALLKDENESLSDGLLIGGLGGSIITFPLINAARKHKQKSVWLYNRNAMLN